MTEETKKGNRLTTVDMQTTDKFTLMRPHYGITSVSLSKNASAIFILLER